MPRVWPSITTTLPPIMAVTSWDSVTFHPRATTAMVRRVSALAHLPYLSIFSCSDYADAPRLVRNRQDLWIDVSRGVGVTS